MIANTLNDHFVNISNIISKSTVNENHFQSLKSYLDSRLKNKVFHIDFISPFQVKKYIQQLKTSKASDVDEIGHKIIKLCGDHIVLHPRYPGYS